MPTFDLRTALLRSLRAAKTPAAKARLRAKLKRARFRPAEVPRALEIEYAAAIRRIARRTADLVRREVLPRLPALVERVAATSRPRNDAAARLDAPGDEFVELLGGVRAQIAEAYSDDEISALAERYGLSVAETNRKVSLENLRRVTGVDVFVAEPWLQSRLETFVAENVRLIRNVPARMLEDVEARVLRGFTRGVRSEVLAAEIEDRLGVGERRAALIARDQLGTLNGQLTEARQTSLQISRYRWQTSLDERVRGNPGGKYPDAKPSHWAREGKIFSWDDPPNDGPDDGHPGTPINCRCVAIPVLEDLLDE